MCLRATVTGWTSFSSSPGMTCASAVSRILPKSQAQVVGQRRAGQVRVVERVVLDHAAPALAERAHLGRVHDPLAAAERRPLVVAQLSIRRVHDSIAKLAQPQAVVD